MALTSIHIQPVKSGSEQHNKREKELDYVRKDKPHFYWQSQNQSSVLADIKERYRKSTITKKHPNGQSLQTKATPIREGVVVVDKSTTMADLHRLADALQAKFGIKCFQLALHQDEGHVDASGNWIANNHAHMVFDWTQDNGKSIKLNQQQMADMQTLVAEVLGMERGESSDRKHLSAIQQKVKSKQLELNEINEEIKDSIQTISDATSTLKNIRFEITTARKERDRKKKKADAESGSRLKKATANIASGLADIASGIADIAGAGKFAERKKEIDSLKAIIASEPERTAQAVQAAKYELQPKLDKAEKQWELWQDACKKAEAERDNYKDEAKKSSIITKVIEFLINAAIDSVIILNDLINNGEATYTGEIHYGWYPRVGWADNATIRRDNDGNCKINGYSRLLDYIRTHPLEDSQRESRGLHI